MRKPDDEVEENAILKMIQGSWSEGRYKEKGGNRDPDYAC